MISNHCALRRTLSPLRLKGWQLVAALCLTLCAAPTSAQAEDGSGLDGLVALLGQVEDADIQLDLLKGLREGLQGRRRVPMPAGWNDVYPKLAASERPAVRQQAKLLAVTFGDAAALAELKKTLLNADADADARRAALESLVAVRAPDIVEDLHKLIADDTMRGPALRGLAALDDPKTPEVILARYADFNLRQRQDAIATLISRPAYAHALLDAVEKGGVPRSDISAFSARQIASFPDKELRRRLVDVWGAIHESSAEKKELIAQYKALLTPETIAAADARHGRAVFMKTCAQCHKLFGAGGDIGPDLTGSNRANLDYVLENVLTPSAAIAKDYQLKTIITVDGRLITGLIKHTGDNALTVQTANEVVVVPHEDIDEMNTSPLSMMPDGLWDKLSADDVRDLVKYLASQQQVPMPDDFDKRAEAHP